MMQYLYMNYCQRVSFKQHALSVLVQNRIIQLGQKSQHVGHGDRKSAGTICSCICVLDDCINPDTFVC